MPTALSYGGRSGLAALDGGGKSESVAAALEVCNGELGADPGGGVLGTGGGGGKLGTDPCSSELRAEAGRGAGGGRAGDFGADPSGGSLGMEAIDGEHRSG